MACPVTDSDLTVPIFFLKALSSVPMAHYLIFLLFALLAYLYNLLEFHFLGDALRGFRGDPVGLTFNPASKIYEGVVSKCRILHERYLVTPWLASPHVQTAFLNYFGNPPDLCYRRQLYTLHDGGTIGLDWLLASDVKHGAYDSARVISKDDSTPIVMVTPGLASDSDSAYLKHLCYEIANKGWNIVISNHRGLGGVSVTSDWFYNAGWTDDLREVANHLNKEYPMAPLFAVGTSIGANILVKYLGQEGENTPFAGAAAICSPHDLLICDRFLNRKPIQRVYDKALAAGLQGYARLHQAVYTRLANWDGMMKALRLREFDTHATCHVGKFETADAYYRWSTSASYISGIAVPLVCISALDDPVCTREAIPWDECRANKNVVLATVEHGGHLAFFKGITACKLWWVGAVSEYLSVLHSSPSYMHVQKQIENTGVHHPLESSIDKTPYVNITEDGMIAAVRDKPEPDSNNEAITTSDAPIENNLKSEQNEEDSTKVNTVVSHQSTLSSGQNAVEDNISNIFNDMTGSVKRSMNQITKQSGKSMWLLAYIALVTSWPVLGSVFRLVFRKRQTNGRPARKF